MQPWAASFYASGRWKKCRAGYIKFRRTIDGGLCEECRDKPGYIVHHKWALTPDNITDPDVSLSYSNLEYVCKDCHDQFDGHGVAKSLTQKIFFDAAGDPIPPSREAGALARSPHALPRKNTQAVHEAPLQKRGDK